MNKESSGTTTVEIGFFGMLTIVFIVLKLLGVVTWSWFWVLSPTIIPLVLALIVAIGIILFVNKA